QVMSPAFSADCLETLEELAIENAETFKALGGESYSYIPALNSREDHLRLLNSLLQANLDALTQTLAHYLARGFSPYVTSQNCSGYCISAKLFHRLGCGH